MLDIESKELKNDILKYQIPEYINDVHNKLPGIILVMVKSDCVGAIQCDDEGSWYFTQTITPTETANFFEDTVREVYERVKKDLYPDATLQYIPFKID